MREWADRKIDKICFWGIVLFFGGLCLYGTAITVWEDYRTKQIKKMIAPIVDDKPAGVTKNAKCACGDDCQCHDCASGGCANRSCCALGKLSTTRESDGASCCAKR